MRFFLVLICSCFFATGFGQYYFNDIISTQLSNEQYKLLRSQKVRKIKATSYEADNSLTEGFQLEEDISMDGKRIILSTATSAGRSAVTNRFYELSKLKRTQSGSLNIDTRTEYSYTDKGQVQKIVLTTTDTAMKSTLTEAHEWQYDSAGAPVQMLKIKNKTDTVTVVFVKDEQGLIAEEHWKKKNRTLETYYYYYDANKKLTDIVRYNSRLKKLIPDFQYEYDSNGRVSQMTQVSMSSASYIIWKYTYTDKGLKQKELGFDKDKKLIGRIEYSYE
ncbi:MAG: hypothetical protein EPO58_15300 [Chitinophagaceae bacterium]|nr:MAG: hypothetical protein EPO58_15300 [Chitinophagaceae bacterium]